MTNICILVDGGKVGDVRTLVSSANGAKLPIVRVTFVRL